jgi:hypothetical protein
MDVHTLNFKSAKVVFEDNIHAITGKAHHDPEQVFSIALTPGWVHFELVSKDGMWSANSMADRYVKNVIWASPDMEVTMMEPDS